ncbi:MAG TPA: hypothetical protein VE075_10410 [Thermoanaerobaculia bacterium]|nr:hypothetical protein [Thermoanaerobaculia bacterium]
MIARAYGGPACPHCGAPLLVELIAAGEQRCVACTRVFSAMPFSPPDVRVVVQGIAEAGPAGAVPCAQHAGNAAVANCSRCGVFMCGLCRVQIDGRELCPACFDRLAAEGALPSARSRVRNYRGLALLAGLGGCWVYFLGLLTGPLTIYFAVQAQRQRRRLEESDGLLTVIAAFVLGLMQIGGGILLILVLLRDVTVHLGVK